MPDSRLAELSGINRRRLCYMRNARNVPAFIGHILSQEGLKLRSILEAKLDAFFHWKNIGHRHEVEIPGSTYIADFQLTSGTFVEVVGMLRYEKYARKFDAKYKFYDSIAAPVHYYVAAAVEYTWAGCPLELRFAKRICSSCGNDDHDQVNGMCRLCYMKAWHLKETTTRKCGYCAALFEKQKKAPSSFCSRKCYWASMELNWPSWDEIDRMLLTNSVSDTAKSIGVKTPTLYKRLRNRRNRQGTIGTCATQALGTRDEARVEIHQAEIDPEEFVP
jgi:hypothetical protein